MRFDEVDLSLASLDVFKPNVVLQVYARMEVGEIFFSPNRLRNICALSASDRSADSRNVDGETNYPMCCYVNFDKFGGPISKL
jgi:hypothetical protein